MRNLKKILALALVFAMTFAFTASAASFTDQAEIGANYVDDVNMLVELGVIAGYPDGSYGPQKNITRAEFAKMAYTLKYGSDTDGNLFAAQTSIFTDVEGNANVAWAKGYINYCANQKIVSGVGNNKFNPQGNITVAEATKMILVILGCDPAKEGFTGANWMANVTSKAIDLGVFDGWVGDPSQLATRELVAKLMRNAIFAPVYEYSAISGLGSQMNALGTAENMTLGEKTMGLLHKEGIVVANERYALDYAVVDGDIFDITVNATEDEEEAVIFYAEKVENGEYDTDFITVDRGLSDDMLGNKVDVYYTTKNTKSESYVEVIGNVLVNSDTVAYTVASKDADVYPNGETSTAYPYIGFEVDGVEVQVKLSKDDYAEKVQKGTDAQNIADVNDAFATYGHVITADLDGDAVAIAAAGENFIADLGLTDGEANLSQYRFVSIDGGKTFPYIFKTNAALEVDITYDVVANYSAEKGTIAFTSLGKVELEDCVLYDGIATDDTVVCYRADGKLVVEKVDVVSGALENYTVDGLGAVVGGNTYYKWAGNETVVTDLQTYFDENPGAMSGATYYVYNGMIMDVEAVESAVAEGNYAVIIKSEYDQKEDAAYVKLGFADNTEGTYKVSKTQLKTSKEPYNIKNAGNRPMDFAKNAFFGLVVKYNLRDDGTVDLSANDLADDAMNTDYVRGSNVLTEDAFSVVEGQVTFNGNTYYSYSDSSVLFVLYGNPYYTAEGEIDVSQEGLTGEYAPVKARAFKIDDVGRAVPAAINNLYIGETFAPAAAGDEYTGFPVENTTGAVASVAFSSSKVNSKYVVAMAMTQGDTYTVTGNSNTDSIAYVVSATLKKNMASDEFYAEFTVINENGLQTLTTVEDVKEIGTGSSVFDTIDKVGSLSKAGEDFEAGGFIRYALNSEGLISEISNDGISKAEISDDEEPLEITNDGTVMTEGTLQLVNIVGNRSGILTYYPTNGSYDPKGDAAQSIKLHDEEPVYIIGIDEDEYRGEVLTKYGVNTGSTEIGKGNALVQIFEGMVIRVFSFAEAQAY